MSFNIYEEKLESLQAVSPNHFGIDTTGNAAWPVRMTNAPETAIVAVG